MTRLGSFLSGVLAIALAPFASAQISEQTQTRLESQAIQTLQTSESLDDLASAAEVLALMKKNESTKTGLACKHISKQVLDGDANMPEALYKRATLYRDLQCASLSGVGKDIDSLLLRLSKWDNISEMDLDELYFVYRLMTESGAFGANAK